MKTRSSDVAEKPRNAPHYFEISLCIKATRYILWHYTLFAFPILTMNNLE